MSQGASILMVTRCVDFDARYTLARLGVFAVGTAFDLDALNTA
jgi:hypothetical protein